LAKNMGTENKQSAIIRENGKSSYAVDISVSGYELAGDEPAAMGGGDLGPSPYDFLTVALGECTVMTIRWYALQKSWPVDHIAANVTYEKKDGQDVFHKTITIEGDQLTAEQRERLFDVAAKCPVQKSLLAAPVITTEWDAA
jgi:putative redox protein